MRYFITTILILILALGLAINGCKKAPEPPAKEATIEPAPEAEIDTAAVEEAVEEELPAAEEEP
ncbi:MAG: hypothetical protein HQ591_06570 [candidate division Zixibacteria bacterium]|nr:hypothetical protein [Candidatus Tariuqbacter arcticus]